MLVVTKIFHFEAAHALFGYDGDCAGIHGHSYELHVCICTRSQGLDTTQANGMVVDFKEVKKLVQGCVIQPFDHKLILSEAFIKNTNYHVKHENLVRLPFEPTAENLLLHFRDSLRRVIPEKLKLHRLKLFETTSSYAEWLEPI